ncbi:MAG: M23 family metallopeptidase [candidate division Zixibacteria bacterium]|nr:M23 family metallopeptidase [candidate division Zixibacteria bacterium]
MATGSGGITIMIVRDDADSAPRSIKLSRFVYSLLRFFLLLLFIAVVVETVTYAHLLSHSRERTRLLKENAELKRYNAKVIQLEQDLNTNQLMLRKMAELAGIEGEFGLDQYEYPDSGYTGLLAAEKWEVPAIDSQPRPQPAGLPLQGWISRTFRPEQDNPKMRHLGIDIAVGVGKEVRATADGVITFAEWDSTFGWMVIMDHVSDFQTVYGHNSKLLVRVGDMKKYGEVIALSGNTGVSSAPHLHYEVRKEGQSVNPEDYLTTKQ